MEPGTEDRQPKKRKAETRPRKNTWMVGDTAQPRQNKVITCPTCGVRCLVKKTLPTFCLYYCPKRCGYRHKEPRDAVKSADECLAAQKLTHVDVPGYVYFIRAEGTDLIKIGMSVRPELRMKNLQYASAVKLTLIHAVFLKDGCYGFEAVLHRKFRHLHSHGEWFRAEAELLDFIKELQGGA